MKILKMTHFNMKMTHDLSDCINMKMTHDLSDFYCIIIYLLKMNLLEY